MMKRILLLITVVTAVATAFVLTRHRRANRALAHAEAHTRSDLSLVSLALNRIAIEDPAALSISSLSNLNSRSLYQLLSRTNNGHRVIEPRPDWVAGGAILDRWGKPVVVKVAFSTVMTNDSNHTVIATVQIWSAGQNGKDEGGLGDDISESVEVSSMDQDDLTDN